MNFSNDLNNFCENYEYSEISVAGAKWRYILAGKGLGRSIVLLNGGSNASEMWMNYLNALSRRFQVLIFDYPMELKTNQELIAGMKELFKSLNIYMPVLIGASFGGYVAQLYTKKYPDSVSNIILLATGGLDADSLKTLKRKYFFIPLLVFFMKICNYKRLKSSIVKKTAKYTKNESPEVQVYAKEMFTWIFKDYTKAKDVHVTNLLVDLLKQEPATPETFENLKGKIMIILPDDDFFSPKMQKSLTDLMGGPKTVTIKGGHISSIIQSDLYIKEILDFLG